MCSAKKTHLILYPLGDVEISRQLINKNNGLNYNNNYNIKKIKKIFFIVIVKNSENDNYSK